MNKTDKRIYATGDMDQLQPFGFQLNNVQDKKEYLTSIINMMFPNQINLEHNKRLKTDEDRRKLRQLKKEIFDLDVDVMVTMRKYFQTINKYEDLSTAYNISFFNFRADKVNSVIQKRLERPKENSIKVGNFYYYSGLDLICKKHYKAKG